jgi:hypothetical protein
LVAAGFYLNKSTSTPPPLPITTPAFYAMAGFVVILSLVSPIVLVGNPWGCRWAALLAVFMALQYFTKRAGVYTDQQAGPIQRALLKLLFIILAISFAVLAISFACWLIWSIYAVLTEFAYFGECARDVKVSIFVCTVYTLLCVIGELAIFVTLLYHKRLAPHWLDEDFPKRFGYAAIGVLVAWIGGLIYFIYYPYAQNCSVQFMTVRSGFAVATLFLLAGLIRFILLRV